MKNHIFLIFFFGFFHASFAQTVAAIADKQKIFIGEQIQLQLFGEFSKARSLTWFAIDSIPHFEILERSKIDTVQSTASTTLKQTLILTSWDSGLWQIPSFVLQKSKTVPVKINVSFSPFNSNQPYHDVKEIIEVKKPHESDWYWYFIFTIVLIALFLLFFPKENKKEKAVFVTDEGAYKTALKKLEKLKEEQPDNKLFYTELINIFREYLHKRKNIQSYSKTTDDLAIQIDQLDFNKDHYQQLVQTLRLSDLVKFAQFHSSSSENKNSLEVIKESITSIEQTLNLKP